VEAALRRRIAETESQKKRLEHQLKLVHYMRYNKKLLWYYTASFSLIAKVLDEMVKAEKAIEKLRAALKGEPVESALKMAHTRLHNRTFRSNVELTRDCPQFA